MKANNKKAPPSKNAPKVEPVVEPPKVEPELPPEEPKVEEVIVEINTNKLRVEFARLPIKQIVSYHSGTILANLEEPSIREEISPERVIEVRKAFAIESEGQNHIKQSLLPSILLKLGYLTCKTATDAHYDELEHLTKEIITRSANLSQLLKQSKEEEQLTEEEFLFFYQQFYACPYAFGEHFRMYVSRGQNKEVLELMLRHCPINSGNGEGLTALHHIAEYNRMNMLDLFIKYANKALLINAQDKYGWTPLHCAAHHGNSLIVQKLLTFPDINIHALNRQGKTALHLACAQNRGNIANILLASGSTLAHQDYQGMTALHEVAYRGHGPLYQDLLRNSTAKPDLIDAMRKKASDYMVLSEA